MSQALLPLFVFALAACGPGRGPTGSTCPATSSLTYENFGRGFFESHCNRCHAASVQGTLRKGAPVTVTFDTVGDIRAQSSDIDQLAASGPEAHNVAMPTTPPRPSDEAREQLGEWLACGAP